MIYTNVMILSEETLLIPQFMDYLSLKIEEVISFIWVAPQRATFIHEVYRTLIYHAYQKGFYANPQKMKINHFSIQDVKNLQALDLSVVKTLLAAPLSYCFSEENDSEDVELVFPDLALECIESIEKSANISFDEDALAGVLNNRSASFLYMDEKALENELQQFLEIKPEKALLSESSLYERYVMLLAMEPWKSLHLVQNLRAHLDALIQRALLNPEDENAHFYLLLFKRRLSDDYDYPPLLDTLFSRDACVQILPPVTNWKIKVIAPTYNRLNSFKRTINSILAQTYPHWELIIIDHASTDGTANYCQKLVEKDSRIRVITKTVNKGPRELTVYYAEIFDALDTELIVSCPDDDWLCPDHFEKHIACLKRWPWAAMVYSGYTLVNKDAIPHHQYGPLYAEPSITNPYIELERLLLAGLTSQSCLMRPQALRAFSQWDVTLPEGCEYGLHDFAIGIFMQSLFESGHVPETLFYLTADASTANVQYDISDRWLGVLEGILRCHEMLFGPGGYPHSVVLRYYQLMLSTNLQSIHRLMTDPESCETNPEIAEKIRLLEAMRVFAQEKMAMSNKYVAHLFENKNAFRTLLPLSS